MKNGKKILLVEDDYLIAASGKLRLEQYGYDVIVAGSGEEAVEMFRELPGIDLILMDINLGRGIDGTQAAEMILGEREIPVVFLSSHTDPEIVEKTEKITSYGYVVKNSGITVLDASIKMAFKLFNEKIRVRDKQLDLEAANEELAQSNEQLAQSQAEISGALAALRESEAFTRAVMDNLPIGVAVNSVDPSVNFTYMNDNFPAIYRTTREALASQDAFWEAVYEDPVFREEMRNRVIGDCASGDPGRMHWEEVPITRNGKIIAYISAGNTPVPGKNLMISTVRDVTERKLAGEELRRREADLAEAQRVARIGSWNNDLVNNTVRWSDELYRIFEVEKSEFPGSYESFLERIHPDDRAQAFETNRVARESGSPFEIEYRIRTRTGRLKHIRETGYAIRDAQGAVIGLFGTAQDITGRRLAENALRQSAARLEAVFESMNDAVFISDVDGNFIDFNSAFATYHRFGGKEECYKTLAEYTGYGDVMFPDGSIAPLDMWAVPRALRGEVASNVEYKLRKKDTGETWWGSYSFAPIRDSNGRISGSVVLARDITATKRAEEDLRNSLSLLNQTQRLTRVGGWRYDVESKTMFWTDETCRIHGLDPDTARNGSIDLVSTSISCYDEADRSAIFDAFKRCIATGEPYDLVFAFTSLDGRRLWIRTTAKAETSNGRISGVLGNILDITDRKRAEEELERAFQDKQLLLTEIQHRAKNNFSMISSMIDIMQSTSRSDDARRALEDVGARVRAFTEMYDLVYSSNYISEVSLDEYFSRITASLPGVSECIVLRTECDAVAVPVKTAINMGLVAIELVSNSLKHGFTGRKGGEISLTLKKNEDGAAFAVADNGAGIPQALDVDSLRSTGLKLVYALVAQIGGVIEVERNNGTRFLITIPVIGRIES